VQSAFKLLLTLATLVYPLVVYFGFHRWSPAWVALLLAALLLLRAVGSRDLVWLVAAGGALVLALAGMGGSWVPLKLYPVMVSAVLLAVFGLSLWKPPTVIERIARMREPYLAPEAVEYTRRVTLAWCGFFVANGAVSAATAVWGTEQVWVFYNGLLAYVLMGAFFGVEWLLRIRMRARIAAAGRRA
jgi:uncharacterized membrane protein